MVDEPDFFAFGGSVFEIKETTYGGRGVFARDSFDAHTPVLKTDHIPAYVINKEYKKEVCSQCFVYQRGRTLKARDTKSGLYFCSSACQITWRSTVPKLAIGAWESYWSFLQTKNRQNGKVGQQHGHRAHTNEGAILRPMAEDVEECWESVRATAHFIREARKGSTAKPHLRALRTALDLPVSQDQMSLLLSGCITAATDKRLWMEMMQLTPADEPYTSKADLDSHVQSYLQLLAIMPVDLLPFVTADNCFQIPTRDSHNSFGIRSLDDNGDEFFGFAIWPEASYFNHSCEPTLSKRRIGRTWEFWPNKPVQRGQELYISYLGGDEKELDVLERRRRLRATWQFECACDKCRHEAGEGS